MTQFRFRNDFASLLPNCSPRRYISHALIIISIIVTLLAWGIDRALGGIFTGVFGMKQIDINSVTFLFICGKILLFQFIHGSALHIFLNSYFLYSAGPEVEARMTRRGFLEFFFGGTIFVAVSLWILAPMSLTIGISGFCMALLSYLYMDLARMRHPMANQVLIMLIINILLGLTGNISFVGHASGAVWGLLWWYMRNKR